MAIAVLPEAVKLRCHRCSQFIGEAAAAVEFVGIVKYGDLCNVIPAPRSVWRCKCGWMNIFAPVTEKVA